MPSNSCMNYYTELHNRCLLVIQNSFANSFGELQIESHSYIAEYEKWIDVVDERPEHSIFEIAFREYQFALLAVAQGLYRQAFMALRLFIELGLVGIQLSVNELELRLWLNNRTDTNWNSILDEQNGLFSAQFFSVFCPEIETERGIIRTLSGKIYRQCSEHVHGNPISSELLPDGIMFSDDSFNHWHELAKSVHFVLTFMFTVRYFKMLKAEKKLEFETIIMDTLGHCPSARALFENTAQENTQ